MDIFNAFPTPVGTFEFEDSESLNKGLSEFLYNVRDDWINLVGKIDDSYR